MCVCVCVCVCVLFRKIWLKTTELFFFMIVSCFFCSFQASFFVSGTQLTEK